MPDALMVKYCLEKEPPHPCDTPPVCNPLEEVLGTCEKPYLCLERLKNPAGKDEITRCLPGPFMNAKQCESGDPDHPCDGLRPCSEMGNKRNCVDPVLCFHRIKNPEVPKKPITSDCDPTR